MSTARNNKGGGERDDVSIHHWDMSTARNYDVNSMYPHVSIHHWDMSTARNCSRARSTPTFSIHHWDMSTARNLVVTQTSRAAEYTSLGYEHCPEPVYINNNH